MSDERDEIRRRVDIVSLVSREVSLKKRGKNWTGLCPFHDDKNPSFTVNSETGRYKCWACGEGGDCFTWVMKRRHVEFPEAMRLLAAEAGVTLTAHDPQKAERRRTQSDAMEEALRFFRETLEKTSAAKEYCERRGIDPETIDTWELGFAPDQGEALAMRLKRNEYSLAEGKELFLVDQDAGGGYFDKFRARLMFPIRDERGLLVAFGGRLLGQGNPKYINSSDTPLYRKSRVLYGFNKARETISSKRHAVLTEGYLDVIACHRAGVTQAVASLGTALSEDHAKLLARWCDTVTIFYDSDEAGQKAADRAIEVLSAEKIKVRLAFMPDGEDPDSLLSKGGPAAVQEAVENDATPLDFRIRRVESKLAPSQDEYWDAVVEALSTTRSELAIAKHLDRLAPLYPGIKDPIRAGEALRKMVDQARRQRRRSANPDYEEPRPREVRKSSIRELHSAEISLFQAFMSEEFRGSGWMVGRLPGFMATGLGERIAQAIATAFPTEAPSGPAREWVHRLEPEEIRDLMGEIVSDARVDRLTDEFVSDTIHRLKSMAEDRAQRKVRDAATDDQAKQRYLEEVLRKRKPDPREASKDPDDYF